MEPHEESISIPSRIKLNAVVPLQLDQQTEPDEKKQHFTMLAYTGAVVQLNGYSAIFETSGIDLGDHKKPILKQHDHNQVVGYSTKLTCEGANLIAEGVLLSGQEHQAAREVISASAQGFPWQASIGLEIDPDGVMSLGDGQDFIVNGNLVSGPDLIVMTTSKLKEISFVPLGADANTHSSTNTNKSVAVALNEDPAFLEIPVSKGSKMKSVESKTTPEEIRNAFPDDLEFAMESICNGLSLEEAKLSYAEKILSEFENLKREKLELVAKLESRKVEALELTAPKPARSAIDQWKEELRRNKNDLGMSNHDAVRTIVIDNPELHAAYLAEYNAERMVKK